MFYFLYGLSFGGLGLAAYLQLRQGRELPLAKQLPWLAAFGFACGITGWIEMFLTSETSPEMVKALSTLRMFAQPITGFLLLIFGWGMLKLIPLPPWTIFIPGILIVPIAYVIAYASTTFITPSPIEIPIDIWSRYLLYLPGSIMAGVGFLRQWLAQRKFGFLDVSNLMLGAGIAFLFEAFVVGLIVPAAPYGPASYYNYDRVVHTAFIGEQADPIRAYGLTAWLDYERVLEATGLPIQFWRMLSAFAVAFFVIRGLGVFEAMRKRQLATLQQERDRLQKEALETHILARQNAENWTESLVNITRQITQLENVDEILLYILESARRLLHSDFSGLALLNEDRSKLLLKCYSHTDKTEVTPISLVVENPLILQAVQSNQTYRSLVDGSSVMFDQICPLLAHPAKAVAIVPIRLDNCAIGAIWVAKCNEETPYSETDLIWLESMADQVVITIQHALMASRLQTLSIIEERARIAREMHDGLAQVLGYLNLQVQTLEALLAQGKHEAARQELRQMRQAIQSAHADVRENILSLRTTLANDKSLVSAIEEYLREFSIQTGVEAQFISDVGELNLASIAEVQLVCILQEALTNVRKHAHATQISVSIKKEISHDAEYICMEISDNGVGFESSDSKRNFGLQTMRERANSVEGMLEIHSSLGKGTTVTCRIPCLRQDVWRTPSILSLS